MEISSAVLESRETFESDGGAIGVAEPAMPGPSSRTPPDDLV